MLRPVHYSVSKISVFSVQRHLRDLVFSTEQNVGKYVSCALGCLVKFGLQDRANLVGLLKKRMDPIFLFLPCSGTTTEMNYKEG